MILAAVRATDVVIWVHVAAVVAAFGSLFTYPVWLGVARRAAPTQRALVHRAQVRIVRFVLNPALVVILGAGIYLATHEDVWSEVWVTVPLVILVVIGGIAGSFLIPREKRLADLAERDDPGYDGVLAQVRAAVALTVLLVLAAMFLMIVKP